MSNALVEALDGCKNVTERGHKTYNELKGSNQEVP